MAGDVDCLAGTDELEQAKMPLVHPMSGVDGVWIQGPTRDLPVGPSQQQRGRQCERSIDSAKD